MYRRDKDPCAPAPKGGSAGAHRGGFGACRFVWNRSLRLRAKYYASLSLREEEYVIYTRLLGSISELPRLNVRGLLIKMNKYFNPRTNNNYSL
ncbi:MAG: helix-turn-helix domain-containing protein [Thermoprotei archaeon]